MAKRHTITVESVSAYESFAMEFLAAQARCSPAIANANDTVLEVRPIYRVTQKRLTDCVHRKAELTRDRSKV